MKRFIALVLSLVMALGLCVPAWGAEGTVVVADTAALQAALYNAADGTTIQLEAGVNYGTVVFGQNAGSKVVDISAIGGDETGNERYSRYENITILGAAGATIDQITFDIGREDANTIWNYIDVENLTIKNVTFSGASTAVMIPDGFDIAIDGLSLVNCKMIDTEGNDRFVYQPHSGHKTMNDKTTGECVMTSGVKNLTITGCEITGAYQVIESRAMENLTITNNTFKGIKARDMLITSDVTNHPNATYTGTITITGNTSIAGEDRFARVSLNNSDVTVIIEDNTITSYLGKAADYIKVDGIDDGKTKVTIANNTLATVAKVGDVEYKTLQEALNVGGTVELLGDIILAAPVTVTKDAVLDLKGFGITATDTTSGVPIYVSSGKLTVRNGELALDGRETTIHGTYNCAIGYEPGTELVVDEVTFTGVTGINGTWKADGAVKISVSNSKFTVSNAGVVVAAGSKEAVATITNCTIDAGEYAIFGSQGAQITVNGGNYTSNIAIYSQDAGTVVTVEGGTFTGALSESNNGKIVIKGGTFSVDPTPYKANGYGVSQNDDGTFTVKKAHAITFNANGGTGEMDEVLILDGGQYQLPKCTFTAPADKQFKGWAESSTAITVLTTPYTVNKDATLYAIWENVPSAPVVPPVEDEPVATTPAETDTVVSNTVIEAVEAVKDSDETTVTVSTPVEGNADAETTIEFKDAEAKKAFANAPHITTELTAAVEEVTTDVESAVSGAEIAVYMDIDIKVLADGEHVGEITQLPEPIKVVIPASALDFEELKEGYTRNVYVIRFHNGVAEKLPAELDDDGNLVFESNLFSTYAVVYEDVKTATIYTVTFMNGDKVFMVEKTNPDGTLAIAGMPGPDAPKGYKFVGWYTEDGVHIKHGDKITSDLIAYAKWEKITSNYPVYGGSDTTPTTVKSPSTFDAGIGLYVGMSVLSAMGGAVVLKKRED